MKKEYCHPFWTFLAHGKLRALKSICQIFPQKSVLQKPEKKLDRQRNFLINLNQIIKIFTFFLFNYKKAENIKKYDMIFFKNQGTKLPL